MKGELSGVGPVFAGVADSIGSGFVASLARRGGRRCAITSKYRLATQSPTGPTNGCGHCDSEPIVGV
jgi:hypothetical protein